MATAYSLKNWRALEVEPIKAILPSVNRMSWLNILNTCDEGWWIVQMTVFPLEAIIFMSVTISWAEEASSPVVGSSQNKRAGSVNNCKRKVTFKIKNFHNAIPQLQKQDVSFLHQTILYSPL